jgi:hypothetical protein
MRLHLATADISFHLRVGGLAEVVGSRSRLADPVGSRPIEDGKGPGTHSPCVADPVGSRSIEDGTGAGTRSPCVAEAVEVP